MNRERWAKSNWEERPFTTWAFCVLGTPAFWWLRFLRWALGIDLPDARPEAVEIIGDQQGKK